MPPIRSHWPDQSGYFDGSCARAPAPARLSAAKLRPDMSQMSAIAFRCAMSPVRGWTAETRGTPAARRPRTSKRSGGVDRRPLLGRMEQQLLNAPVQDFGHIQLVLGWAGHFMDPPELLELLARFAEHAEHLAVEAQLVDAARKRIRAVEHLVGGRGDAERPRCARRHGAAGLQVI